jgi:tetratricopeptide (TPR) repeat protein
MRPHVLTQAGLERMTDTVFVKIATRIALTTIFIGQPDWLLSATAANSTWVKDMNLAEQALHQRDWSKCERHYTDALKEARSPNGSTQRLASTLTALSLVECRQGRVSDAESLACAAVALTDKEPYGPILAKNLRVLAHAYLHANKYELCYSTLKRALAILDKAESNLTVERIYVLRMLSDVCLQRKDLAGAELFAEQLVNELERLRIHKGRFRDDLRDAHQLLATRLLQQARGFAERGDFDRAMELLKRALSLKIDHPELAVGMEELAQYSRAMQPPKPAKEQEDKQLKLAELCRLEAYALRCRLEKTPSEGRLWDSACLATLYLYQDRRTESEQWLRKAQSLIATLPETQRLATVYFSLSAVNEGLGYFPAAAEEMSKSLRIMKAHRDNYPESQIVFTKAMLDKQLAKISR